MMIYIQTEKLVLETGFIDRDLTDTHYVPSEKNIAVY